MILHNPKDAISVPDRKHKTHGTPIKELVGKDGMRVMGRALDLVARRRK